MGFPKLALLALLAVTGCVVTATNAPVSPPPQGHVIDVQEVAQEVHGDPAAGAVAGGVIGALLFDRNPVAGAIVGAGVGAAASSGSGVSYHFVVTVQFDDGQRRGFSYPAPPVFRIGDPVVWTADGLELIGPPPPM